VGGAYINGTAEIIFKKEGGGLINCQAPFGYALSLVFGSFVFIFCFFINAIEAHFFTVLISKLDYFVRVKHKILML